MIRDPRPVFEQVKSGLKIAAFIVILSAAVLVLWSFAQYRIEAWAWHWKNGNSIDVGEFRVPVPNEWRVWQFETGSTREVQLINTKGGKPFWATITISQTRWREAAALADLVSFQRRSMENLGVRIRDTREFEIGGVAGICLDGEMAMLGSQARNFSCRVGSDFSLDYLGSALKAPAFYTILSGVSRVPKG